MPLSHRIEKLEQKLSPLSNATIELLIDFEHSGRDAMIARRIKEKGYSDKDVVQWMYVRFVDSQTNDDAA